jgi:hypothetical protein
MAQIDPSIPLQARSPVAPLTYEQLMNMRHARLQAQLMQQQLASEPERRKALELENTQREQENAKRLQDAGNRAAIQESLKGRPMGPDGRPDYEGAIADLHQHGQPEAAMELRSKYNNAQIEDSKAQQGQYESMNAGLQHMAAILSTAHDEPSFQTAKNIGLQLSGPEGSPTRQKFQAFASQYPDFESAKPAIDSVLGAAQTTGERLTQAHLAATLHQRGLEIGSELPNLKAGEQDTTENAIKREQARKLQRDSMGTLLTTARSPQEYQQMKQGFATAHQYWPEVLGSFDDLGPTSTSDDFKKAKDKAASLTQSPEERLKMGVQQERLNTQSWAQYTRSMLQDARMNQLENADTHAASDDRGMRFDLENWDKAQGSADDRMLSKPDAEGRTIQPKEAFPLSPVQHRRIFYGRDENGASVQRTPEEMAVAQGGVAGMLNSVRKGTFKVPTGAPAAASGGPAGSGGAAAPITAPVATPASAGSVPGPLQTAPGASGAAPAKGSNLLGKVVRMKDGSMIKVKSIGPNGELQSDPTWKAPVQPAPPQPGPQTPGQQPQPDDEDE